MKPYDHSRKIIEQLVERVNTTPSTRNKKMLLIAMTGTDVGVDKWLKEMVKIKGYGYRIHLALSRAAENMVDIDQIKKQIDPEIILTEKSTKSLKSLKEADGVIVPLLTQNTAVKVALGIQDQLVPMLLWKALWMGKSVWMNFDGLLIGNHIDRPFMREMMEGYIVQLKRMGVEGLTDINFLLQGKDVTTEKGKDGNFSNTLEQVKLHSYRLTENINYISNHSVVTEKDILNLSKEIKEMIVPSGGIITPLALDRAKELGIKVIKKKAQA